MKTKDPLSPVVRRFVLHWGEMGTRWGVNRTVAQVHALLFLSEHPLNADQLVAALQVARSNISTSLKELVGWGIIRLVHVDGDRRDHYVSLTDVFELFRTILNERRRREFDPTAAAVGELAAEAADEPVVVRQRLDQLAAFLTSMGSAFDQVGSLPPAALAGLLSASGMVRRLLPKEGGRNG